MEEALAMHDECLRAALHTHCGYEVSPDYSPKPCRLQQATDTAVCSDCAIALHTHCGYEGSRGSKC